MDSVELARQVAAELHARLVASGADPWSPYDFAVSEAKRRGIDVEPTAAGAAVLNGGRATFVTADDLILHESVGSAFEQAFLVAHEIGHVERRQADIAQIVLERKCAVDRTVPQQLMHDIGDLLFRFESRAKQHLR